MVLATTSWDIHGIYLVLLKKIQLRYTWYYWTRAPVENHAFPKLPLPLDRLNGSLDVEAPPLIKGYLKLGAKICSAPAWDPDFNTADLLTMLRLSDMNPRYAKHFLDKVN